MWQKEREIVEVMTIKKLTKKEVYETYAQLNSYNRFQALADLDEGFPVLGNEGIKVVNDDAEINKRLVRRSYSAVLRRPMPVDRVVPSRPPKPKIPIIPVYERPEWTKVSEIEKIINLLCNRFDIGRNDPLISVIAALKYTDGRCEAIDERMNRVRNINNGENTAI